MCARRPQSSAAVKKSLGEFSIIHFQRNGKTFDLLLFRSDSISSMAGKGNIFYYLFDLEERMKKKKKVFIIRPTHVSNNDRKLFDLKNS
jgi:hypothetical protein